MAEKVEKSKDKPHDSKEAKPEGWKGGGAAKPAVSAGAPKGRPQAPAPSGPILGANGQEIRGIVRMVATEQDDKKRAPHMSMVLWDLFTGSATYREILWRALHPGFLSRLVWNVIVGHVSLIRGKLP